MTACDVALSYHRYYSCLDVSKVFHMNALTTLLEYLVFVHVTHSEEMVKVVLYSFDTIGWHGVGH